MTGDTGEATARLVVRKAFVEVGGTAVLRGFSMIRLVVLARLFLPEQYGAYSTGLIVLAPGLLLLQSGFRQYAVKVEESRLSAALTAGLILTTALSLATAAAMALLAPALGRWLGDPDLATVVYILTLSLLDGPTGMYQAVLDRRLDFLRPKVTEAVAMVLGLGATVVLFRSGVRPAASMAAGHAVMTIVRGVGLIWLARPLPPIRWNREEFAGAFRFTVPMFGTSGFAIVGERADDLAVRYFHGNTALGVYTVAFYVPALIQEVALALDRITLPVLGALDTLEERRRAFADSTRIIAFVSLPLGMGLAGFSRPLLHFLLGSDWVGAAAPLSVLGVAFGIRAVSGTNWGALAFLSDQTRYVGKVSVANALLVLAVGVPLIYWQGPLGGALYALAYALVLGPALRLPLMHRALGDVSFIRAAARPLAASVGLLVVSLMLGSQTMAPVAGTVGFVAFIGVAMAATAVWDVRLRRMLSGS